MASSNVFPHTNSSAVNPSQTFGRKGESNIIHVFLSLRCMHLTPAGLPLGIPGISDDIEIAIQQAPHPILQSITN